MRKYQILLNHISKIHSFVAAKKFGSNRILPAVSNYPSGNLERNTYEAS